MPLRADLRRAGWKQATRHRSAHSRVGTRSVSDLRRCVALYQSLCVPKIRFSIDGGDRRDKLAASDDRSVQADYGRPSFALQVKSKAGSRNPGSTATDQCASPTGVETTAPQQYRSFSVCLALSLVSLRPWRDCDCQAGDDRSLAPCRLDRKSVV